jgi:hypothetical protein
MGFLCGSVLTFVLEKMNTFSVCALLRGLGATSLTGAGGAAGGPIWQGRRLGRCRVRRRAAAGCIPHASVSCINCVCVCVCVCVCAHMYEYISIYVYIKKYFVYKYISYNLYVYTYSNTYILHVPPADVPIILHAYTS